MPSPSCLKTVSSPVVRLPDLQSFFLFLQSASPISRQHLKICHVFDPLIPSSLSDHISRSLHPLPFLGAKTKFGNSCPLTLSSISTVGWGNTPIEPAFGSAGSREDASVKSKLINLISSVRTLMRSTLAFIIVVPCLLSKFIYPLLLSSTSFPKNPCIHSYPLKHILFITCSPPLFLAIPTVKSSSTIKTRAALSKISPSSPSFLKVFAKRTRLS